jgi:hypothetical protein
MKVVGDRQKRRLAVNGSERKAVAVPGPDEMPRARGIRSAGRRSVSVPRREVAQNRRVNCAAGKRVLPNDQA